ncbi:MAG: glycosyltransferase family 39 protein [Fischerella sp.]|nr:glycosyltransferase family 39 protein [Fischerella sp.]
MSMLRCKNILLQLLSIVLFVGLVILIRFQPIAQTFEFDYDEGFNLMKAFLYSQGFALYTEIWNDQPPVFTILLSHWLKIFGNSIFAARLLTLLFSALLIWCFYQIIRLTIGSLAALVATILLFTSWLYIRLSISVMIGIPSLALAMLSIYFLYLYKINYYSLYLVLSGGFLALSLQTKLFTLFLIPLILFELLILPSKYIDKLKNIALWLTSLVFVYILLGLQYQQFWNYEQLLVTHFNQPSDLRLENFNNLKYLNYMISQDYDYIFLAFIGIWAIFSKKQKNGIFPFAWLVTATLILLKHQPIWYHYYPLLAIPICWLAAYGFDLFTDSVIPKNHSKFNSKFNFINLKILTIPYIFILILIYLIIITPPNPRGTVPKNMEIVQMVLKYKNSTQWIFTDNPIYGFYAGLRVPPEIAVMSYKRLNSGDLTSTKMLAVLQDYRPEQIILTRWTGQIKSDRNLMNYIKDNYSRTYSNHLETEEHYVLK